MVTPHSDRVPWPLVALIVVLVFAAILYGGPRRYR